MNSTTCPECGATIKPGTTLCPACLLSAGAATVPIQPVSAGITSLPCVFGGYRLMKKLGSGGMGIVYEAEELESGRRLALKVLNQSLDNEEQRQRFLREGRLAATIDHPRSVYVFGTEEIDGVPVIAMELAEGGTLRDELKRRGTMPVRDAVDAILGVLDGLEAAHAKGILHRDMKPTNCFVTSDGHAIVGDYGLSVSQNQPTEDCLTQCGTIMGTPAFSPPEQLRGQPLDQRADIYSTGGTLYYLLTGKAPVEANSQVETVAAVLEGRITQLAKLRADVPADLSAVVMRCLSADAAKRPATHAEMRQALMPFSSVMPEPAPLGLRLLAGVVDLGILEVTVNALKAVLALWGNVDLWLDWSWAQVMLVGLPYFILLECFWGTTPGKVLCGLCVRRQQGGRPGIGATALRAVLILGLPAIASILLQELRPSVLFALRDDDSTLKTIVYQIVMALFAFAQTYTQLLLFIPVFRRSDHAGWHDILTGVRVVRRAKPSLRKRALTSASEPVSTTEERWGPFVPGTVISPDWRHGHDPVLKRPVLLQRRAEAAPTSKRRDCNRSGRLRWMQGVSDPAGTTWDVWQSPAGTTLPALIENEPPAWSELLSWMQDLTDELDAAQKDQTLPPTLSLSQVWITTDGRAVLLDEPWPGTASKETTTEPQAFLHTLASLAVPEKRPMHADSLLQGLGSASFERLSHVAGNLTHLQPRRADVSHRMRATCLIGSLVLPVFMIVVGMFASDSFSKATWDREYRGVPQLSKVLMLHDEISRPDHPDADARDAVECHLIHQWSWLKQGDGIKNFQGTALKPQEEKGLLAVLSREPAEIEVSVADEKVRELLAARLFSPLGVDLRKALAPMALLLLALIAFSQLVTIVLFGSPMLMWLTGVAAVTLAQRPASRMRMLWRWIIGWSAIWAPALVMAFRFLITGHDPIRTLPQTSLIWVPVILVLAIIALLPRRSLVDRLAGTWLVAR